MKTRNFILICIMLFILSFIVIGQDIIESVYYENDKELGGDVIIKKSTIKFEGNNSYRIFEIESPEEGDYFLCAWLMGVIKEDNYLDYELLINGEKIKEKIKPEKSNWQKIELKDSETKEQITVKLLKGINTIAFKAEVPIIAEVEFIRLSKIKEKADISDENYRNYIDVIREEIKEREKNPVQYKDTLKTLKDMLKTTLPNPEGNYYHHVDIVCRYTWFSSFVFSNGQSIYISTDATGGYENVIEVFSYYHPDQYSWVKKSYNGQATLNISIPYSGIYAVRVRAYRQTSQGLVDVNVNGQYYYGDCPVSGNGARYPHETPMLYNYFTAKNYYTDPFLFIEDDSGIPGKIIAWNNDYSGSGDFFWGLNARVKKDFSVRVGAGLISSFRSWFDNGTCDLYLKCQNSNIMGSWCDLEADDAIQSAPYSPAYNCASWGGGRIDLGRYFWASDSPYSNNKSSDWYVAPYQYPYYYTVEEAFWKSWNNFFGNTPPRFVGAPNYTRSGAYSYNAEIAMFGTSSSIYDYEHVAVTKPGNDQPHGYDWESKPGANMRTFHPRDAIGGDLYGSIQTYYRRSSSLKTTYSFEESVALGLTILPEIYISNEESNKIEKLKELINTSVKYDFEIKFSALLEKSQSPELKLYSNPIHIYESIEFKQLLTLCNEKSKKILPFLFEKVFEKGSAESNELAAIVLNEITTEYSALMEEVKEEYKNNCYTFNGAYIAPSPMNNTKKFIKKLLNLYDLHTGEIENVEISKENHIGIIDNFEIFSMYPNPFKQYTNIKFMLLDDSYISLNVYNLNGEIVCTLINNEERNAGEHTLEWAPDNLSSGLYICRLEVNSKVYNRRFLIEE